MSAAETALPTIRVTVAVFTKEPVAARADRTGNRIGDGAAGRRGWLARLINITRSGNPDIPAGTSRLRGGPSVTR